MKILLYCGMKYNVLNVILFGGFIIFSALSFGCKKDKPQEKPPANLLTDRIWKTSAVDANPSTNPDGEILYTNTSACALDNTFTFQNDGTCSIDLGTLKCYESEIKLTTSDYSIDLANKKISFFKTTYELLELSEHQLKFGKPIDVAGYQYLVYVSSTRGYQSLNASLFFLSRL